MAVIIVPSGTVALSNWSVPWKRHGSAGPCAKAVIGYSRSITADIKMETFRKTMLLDA